MFHLDTVRLIRKTFNRFFSLVMITAIGVAFMMGLLSTREVMEKSVDRYDDEMNLHDVQIYSSYGFDDNDIREIRKQDFVDSCFPSRFADVLCHNADGDSLVIRVEEVNRDVDKYELIDGRMPVKDNEMLAVSDGRMKTGMKLELYLDDEDISELLENQVFTVVGIVKAPSYLSKIPGTSTYKNLDLDIIGYIPNSNFLREYYSTVYLTVNEADSYNSFNPKYSDYIDEVMADMEVFASRQQDSLKERLLEEYRQEIEEGENELAEKKAEGQKQLDEAKEKLDDAKIQIIASETQLTSMKSMLNSTISSIAALERQYSVGAETEKRIKDIEKNDPQGRDFTAIMAEITQDHATYQALKSMKDGQGSTAYQQQIEAAEEENRQLNEQLNNELYPERDRLNAVISNPDSSEEEIIAASERLATVNQEIIQAEATIRTNEIIIENLRNMSADTDLIDRRMKEIDDKYGGSIEEKYAEYSDLSEAYTRMEALKSERQVADEAIKRIRQEISSAEAQLQTGKNEYEAGMIEYKNGLIKFTEEIEKAETEIRKAYQELDELPDAKWMILDRDSHYSTYMFANNAKQMGAIGWALPVLFYLVAALVCMTTMTRLVDEQRGQIGIFRALGFSKGQIIMKYVIYALSATFIGSIVGLFSGMAIFPPVIYQTWRLMYDLPDMLRLFPARNVIICLLSFSVLMATVTWSVTNGSLSEAPSQLMRPKAPKKARKVFLENIEFLWRRLSFTSKITARNLIRYKARFFMTVIGVAGCTGLLVLGWGIKDSISDVVAIQFNDLLNYNYSVHLENDHALDDMVAEAEKDLNNEYVTPFLSYSTKVYLDSEEKVATVQVMDARKGNDILNLRASRSGEEVRLSNSGVIVTEKFADVNGIKKGDYITIESESGLKASVKVADVCEWYFQHYIYISADYYRLIFEEPIHYNTIAIKTDNGSGLEEKLAKYEGFESVVDFTNMIEQFNTMLEALNYIIMVIIITAGSLAFVVLINLTQVNISERIREIATLKVLGFRAGEVNSYIFKEIMLLAIIGGLVGMPLGVVEHHFVMGIIDMEMIRFGTNIKLLSFVYGYVITVVFTVIVLLFTRRHLRNVEMIESLKSVE